MIMSPCVNANHVLSYLLVSTESLIRQEIFNHSYMLEGNIQIVLIYLIFNNKTNFFLILYEPYEHMFVYQISFKFKLVCNMY